MNIFYLGFFSWRCLDFWNGCHLFNMRLSLHLHGNSFLALHSIQCILSSTSHTEWKWIIFVCEIFYFPNICEDFVFSSVCWNLCGYSTIGDSVLAKQNYSVHEALIYASSWSLQRGLLYINLLENCTLTLFVKQTHRLHWWDSISFNA